MVAAPLPANEAQRLESLHRYAILDTPFEKDYDDLCRLAATVCKVPIAMISFVDKDRQWFKSVIGLDTRETSRDIAFCAHAIWEDGVFEIKDATEDDRFFDNPLVVGSPELRFYAGQPLKSSDGMALGTLCTIDRVPRVLDEGQREALAILARQVVNQLELRRAAQELVRLNEDKDRFFSVIAHDLRSPFSGLLGLVDLIHAHGASMDRAEIDKYLGMLHNGLHNVYALSDNLLKWAQLEQGKLVYTPETVAVSVLVDDVVATLEEAASRKGVVLSADVPDGLEVTCDRNMVEAALRNLGTNALKFSSSGGSVVLSARLVNNEWRLSVTDTGLGMDEDQLAALRQGKRLGSQAGTAGEPGTGLGLTLARQFAAKNGGRLEFDSKVGQGTTATVVLPA
jgi:signal transduction histidine kinase